MTNQPARDERSIEDYLFDGYRPPSYNDDIDNQQFAQSIEDEDLFGSTGEEFRTIAASTTSQINQPTARSKFMQLKQKIKEQALARGLTPRFTPDSDGMIEIEIEKCVTEPESRARAIFERFRNRPKDKYGLYKGQKLHWCRYNRYLQDTISAQKRKQWDSFQHPPDKYDDEEELIGDYDEEPDYQEGEALREEQEKILPEPKRNRIDDDDSDSEADQEGGMNEEGVDVELRDEQHGELDIDSVNESDKEASSSDEDPLASEESDFDDE